MPFPDDLTEIHHRTVGGGPAAILTLHGGMGLDHTSLSPWLDPLGADATVIYWDQRGNGRSVRLLPDALSLEGWADDAAALADLLHLERPCLFAHSFGAAIAVTAALRHPRRFAGLILCAPQLTSDFIHEATANLTARGTSAMHAAVAASVENPSPTDEETASFWRTMEPLYFHHPDRDPVLGRTLFSGDAFGRSQRQIAPTLALLDDLERLDLPVLLLAGRHDWLLPVEHTITRPLRHLRDGQARIFEESGHFPFVEEPEAFASTVSGWLQGTAVR